MSLTRHSLAFHVALACTLALSAQAQTTTYTGPNSGGSDVWNNASHWDNGIPTGTNNAVVPAGKQATAWNTSTPAYTGDLTIGNNAEVRISWLQQNVADYNALGTPGTSTIFMQDNSIINIRSRYTPNIPRHPASGKRSHSVWLIHSATR